MLVPRHWKLTNIRESTGCIKKTKKKSLQKLTDGFESSGLELEDVQIELSSEALGVKLDLL